jgi:hypothetical protein
VQFRDGTNAPRTQEDDSNPSNHQLSALMTTTEDKHRPVVGLQPLQHLSTANEDLETCTQRLQLEVEATRTLITPTALQQASLSRFNPEAELDSMTEDELREAIRKSRSETLIAQQMAQDRIAKIQAIATQSQAAQVALELQRIREERDNMTLQIETMKRQLRGAGIEPREDNITVSGVDALKSQVWAGASVFINGTALHCACMAGHIKIIKVITDYFIICEEANFNVSM